ncbi:hypothetical protein D3C85_1799830 [compost metagenome]
MMTDAVEATIAQMPLEMNDFGLFVGKKKRNLQSIKPNREIAPLPYSPQMDIAIVRCTL